MKNKYPLVSIITLNYNQPKVTCEFLLSCKKLTYPNYEILVCDMNSEKDPSSIIKPQLYDGVTLLLSNKNLGFAGGNNWGMQFAHGDYILLLNNDTEVSTDLIEKLMMPFDKDPLTGVVCPQINYFDPSHKIQYAGFSKMNKFTGRTTTIGHREDDRGQYHGMRLTSGAHGAAMMIKREVIQKTGRFPEIFFLYYEEWDWSTRILRAGYKIYVQGDTRIYHKESVSVGKTNPMKEYYLTRNRILYMRRNSKGIKLILFSVFFTFFTIPKTIIKYLLHGKTMYLKAFIKGIRDNFTMSSHSPL